jgi:hypothetical protein
MRVDFQRDSRVRMPELGLGPGNRNSEICEQPAGKMPAPVPTHATRSRRFPSLIGFPVRVANTKSTQLTAKG